MEKKNEAEEDADVVLLDGTGTELKAESANRKTLTTAQGHSETKEAQRDHSFMTLTSRI